MAATIFGGTFGYTLTHAPVTKNIRIAINEVPDQQVGYVYRCPFGSRITAAVTESSNQAARIDGLHVYLSAATQHVSISYE